MIRIAIIGTNWITKQFLQGALDTNQFVLSAVYSRTYERASEFSQFFPYDIEIFTDINKMAQSDCFDVVYIASPNSLHYEQSVLMLNNDKHVICEKPMASNFNQAKALFEIAEKNNKLLFEAFKTEYLPNYSLIKKHLEKIGKIHKVHINYCQYSSRYQRYLDGENPNTFNPNFSNGSIMDIGFYCTSIAISLFGEPKWIKSSAHLLDSGVDAHGTAIFHYPNFEVVISHSKVSNSMLPSEIQGEFGSMLIPDIPNCDHIVIKTKEGGEETFRVPQHNNTMIYEAKYCAEQINSGHYCEKAKSRTLAVSKSIAEIRRQTGVHFPSD